MEAIDVDDRLKKDVETKSHGCVTVRQNGVGGNLTKRYTWLSPMSQDLKKSLYTTPHTYKSALKSGVLAENWVR
jgi:hypothetical protein